MDLQFHGANCLSVSYKGARIVIDDNLAELGSKSIIKPEDVALYTSNHKESSARLTFDGPGEYEVSDISIIGIAAQSHLEESKNIFNNTMFKLIAGEQSILVTGHVFPGLNDNQLEVIGHVDVLVVPVGGKGFTVDPVGALQIIKAIEPKIVVPTHFADKSLKYEVPQEDLSQALKEMGFEPKETVSKLKLKSTELSEVTHIIVLERV
jgi:L-ascorbate metabolism protein UlaG (beta-lactamase superfamily)